MTFFKGAYLFKIFTELASACKKKSAQLWVQMSTSLCGMPPSKKFDR